VPVDRNWTILEQPIVIRDDDPDELEQGVYEILAILRRVGGTVQIASQRRELAPGAYVTESYIVAYSSFVPLIGRVEHDAGADVVAGDELTAEEIAQHFPDPEDEQAAAAVTAPAME
jgi:hypothetical protein